MHISCTVIRTFKPGGDRGENMSILIGSGAALGMGLLGVEWLERN